MTPHRLPDRAWTALFTGLLVPLAFPFVVPWDPAHEVLPGGALDLVAFVALVPLLRAAAVGTPRRAFGLAWGAGLLAFALLLYWLHVAMMTFGGLPGWASVGAVAALSAWCALFWGLAVGMAVTARRALGWPLWAALPLTWTGAELLRSELLSGFPWAHLGYALARTPLLAQLASLGGVALIAALIAGVNGALAEVWLVRDGHEGVRPGPRWGLATAGLALVLTMGWGAWRLHALAAADAAAPTLEVAVVQGNVDQRIKNLGRRMAALVMDSYVPATAEAARAGARLVIWPESVLPYGLPEGEVDFTSSRALRPLLGTGARYVLSATTVRREDDGLRRRNAAFLVDDRLSVLGRYDKQHLVPFGEYVPLEGVLPMDKIVPVPGRFEPGERLSTLPAVPGAAGPADGPGAGDVRLGTTVCFDALFPEIPQALSGDAHLLANQSNDAWYGRSAAPHQFLRIVAMRAVENGRWLARAANTGVSAFIDPAGRVVDRTGLGLVPDGADEIDAERQVPPAVLRRAVPLLSGRTPYAALGDLFAWACLTGSVILAAQSSRRRRGPPARDV